jgi:hypothetical protein
MNIFGDFKKIFIKNCALAIFNTTSRNAYMFFTPVWARTIQKRSSFYKNVNLSGRNRGAGGGKREKGEEIYFPLQQVYPLPCGKKAG